MSDQVLSLSRTRPAYNINLAALCGKVPGEFSNEISHDEMALLMTVLWDKLNLSAQKDYTFNMKVKSKGDKVIIHQMWLDIEFTQWTRMFRAMFGHPPSKRDLDLLKETRVSKRNRKGIGFASTALYTTLAPVCHLRECLSKASIDPELAGSPCGCVRGDGINYIYAFNPCIVQFATASDGKEYGKMTCCSLHPHEEDIARGAFTVHRRNYTSAYGMEERNVDMRMRIGTSREFSYVATCHINAMAGFAGHKSVHADNSFLLSQAYHRHIEQEEVVKSSEAWKILFAFLKKTGSPISRVCFKGAFNGRPDTAWGGMHASFRIFPQRAQRILKDINSNPNRIPQKMAGMRRYLKYGVNFEGLRMFNQKEIRTAAALLDENPEKMEEQCTLS